VAEERQRGLYNPFTNLEWKGVTARYNPLTFGEEGLTLFPKSVTNQYKKVSRFFTAQNCDINQMKDPVRHKSSPPPPPPPPGPREQEIHLVARDIKHFRGNVPL
jgi:hypothetical protein